MTEKLYYENAYIFDFSATVTGIIKNDRDYSVILDKTAFFPEGGGQPGDNGQIDSTAVFDTVIENGIILHKVINPGVLKVGKTVSCKVDKDVRFSRMQAHTGEHIISGIAHKMFGVENVGFHMDGTVMTVDFNKYLSKEELNEIEKKANICVYENVIVKAKIYNEKEIDSLVFRSKTDGFKETRIVEIEGYDACACCAPHVKRTGEIGLIKILSSVKHRGGLRITLICGITAYNDYLVKHNNTLIISDLLCSKHDEADKAVIKLLEKEKELKYQLVSKTNSLIDYIFDNTESSEKNVVFRIDGLTNEELKSASLKLKGKSAGITAVVSGNDEKGYYFAAASDAVKVQDFTSIITSALNGSGGGRFDVIQGRFNADFCSIKEFFNSLKVN